MFYILIYSYGYKLSQIDLKKYLFDIVMLLNICKDVLLGNLKDSCCYGEQFVLDIQQYIYFGIELD